MPQLPEVIVASMSPTSLSVVTRWWNTLTTEARAELTSSWSRRSETCRYSWQQGKWQALPVLVGARFLSKDEHPTEDEGWHQDWFEYLLDNPELVLSERTFHICSAHPEARKVLQQGLIPADFECKLGRAHCPMKALLAGQAGCDVKLFPVTR